MGIVDVGIIRDRSPGPKATLLNEKQAAVVTPAKPKINDLQSELFVKGKGFTIKPIKKPGESVPNSMVKNTEFNHEKSNNVLPPSYVKYEKVNSNPNDYDLNSGIYANIDNKWKSENEEPPPIVPSAPTLPNVIFANPRTKSKNKSLVSSKESSDVTDAPNVSLGSSRPKISDPVLEGTTAKELLADGANLVPTRKAPSIPLTKAPNETSTEGYDKELPPVPDDSFKNRPISNSDKLMDEKKLLKELKENKEYPALTKIASLMKSASINRSSSVNEKNKAKIKPEIRKLKFDKEKLKNIEISNPIPQVDSGGAAEKETTTILRAQSMREPSQPKPNLQSFGSMRIPSGANRPTSIHVHSRPTSPPPRPPPPKNLSQEYSYDDCLNLLTEKNAPLAQMDNSPTNNIYAVIEDSPKLSKKLDNNERKVHFDDGGRYEEPVELEKSESQSAENKKSFNKVGTGSTESMGLLSEIVSEIQARNLDSIYSSGTLKKKKEKEKGSENFGASSNSNNYYGNLSSNKNEPKNSNSTASSEFNNSVVKNVNQPKPPMIFNDLSKKTGSEETPKVNNTDVNTYKPFSSSLIRNSGPLASSYKDKFEPKMTTGDKDLKKDFLTSNKEVEPSISGNNNNNNNSNTPSSASPFVKSSFTRPSLLSTPTLPKTTPLSITSNFPKTPEEDDGGTSKSSVKTTKTLSNLPGGGNNKKTTEKNKSTDNLSGVTKMTSSKPNVLSRKPSPSRKTTSLTTEKEGTVMKPLTRPLPSIPKPSVKTTTEPSKTSSSSSSLNRKNSRENLTNKIPNGNKKQFGTERKPEISKEKPVPKRNVAANGTVSGLQSKFESTGNVSFDNKKTVPPVTSTKSKFSNDSNSNKSSIP